MCFSADTCFVVFNWQHDLYFEVQHRQADVEEPSWTVQWAGVMGAGKDKCWAFWGVMGPIQLDICDGRFSLNNPKEKTHQSFPLDHKR